MNLVRVAVMRILVLILILLISFVILYDIVYAPAKKYILPNIIWSYWHDRNIPKDVKRIIDHRRRIMDSYEHIVLHEDTVWDYIDDAPPPNFDSLGHAHKADWIRLVLLKKYGGCWMDASIIVNSKEAIDTLFNNARKKRVDLSAFYLDTRTFRKQPHTYIENWFIIAPKQSPLIQKWLNEYEYAIRIGFEQYKKQVHVRIPKYNRFSTYLTQHVCLQIVIQKSWVLPNIDLSKAEDSMFKIHSTCWKYEDKAGECIMNKIRTDKTIPSIVPFIKLTNGERKTGIDISSYFE